MTVQGLYPLTVQHVRLAAREALDRGGADQTALEATRFKRLEQGNPVDAGGPQGPGADAVRAQPVGEGVQVGGVRAEGAYELGVGRTGHADHDLVGTDVHTSGVRVNLGQAFEGSAFGGSWALALTQFAHGGLL